jgi:chromosome segregation ATPase
MTETGTLEFEFQNNNVDGGLSGGQKSLLSMSFVFALANCKPGPVYLLDEIDAALDERYQVSRL